MTRRARVLQVFGLLGIVWMVSACGNRPVVEGGPSDYFFPTYPYSGEAPLALTRGQLATRNGCLFLDAPAGGGVDLPLWPSVFTLSGTDSPIVITDQGDELHVGDVVRLGGGERSREQAEDLIGGRIPERCSAQGYWLVSRVVGVVESGGS